MLDKLYNNYADFIDEKLDNVTEVLASVFASGLSDKNAVIETLKKLDLGLSPEFSKTLEEVLTGVTSTNKNASNETEKEEKKTEESVNTDYGYDPEERTEKAQQQFEVNQAEANTVSELIKKIGKVTINSGDSIERARQAYNNLTNDQKGLVTNLDTLEKAEKSLKDKVINFIKKNKKEPDKAFTDYSDTNQAIWNLTEFDMGDSKVLSGTKLNELEEALGIKHNNFTKNGNLYKKLKAMGLPYFYKVGSKNIPEDRLAVLAEEGAELHFDKSQGVLRQVGKGDKIFTAEMTDKLWDIAKGNNIGIPDSIKNMKTTIPNIIPLSQAVNNDIKLSIVLPGVQNYEQFKSELVRDKNFEKFVQQVSIGSTLGNNSLTKYKF